MSDRRKEISGQLRTGNPSAREAALLAENQRLRDAARPLANLPIPITPDERVQWLTHQNRLVDALAGVSDGDTSG